MTAKETEIFIQGLEARPDLISCKPGSVYKSEKDIIQGWKDIAMELVAEGFEKRSVKALQKKWTDLKFRARKKSREIEQSKLKNTEDKCDVFLTAVECRALHLAESALKRAAILDNPAFKNKRARTSKPPVVNKSLCISLSQVGNSSITGPSNQGVSTEAPFSTIYDVRNPPILGPPMPEVCQQASSPTLNQVPSGEEESYPSTNDIRITQRMMRSRNRKRVQDKINFNKLLDVELKKLKLKETTTELLKKKLLLKEKKVEVLGQNVTLLKTQIQVSKEKLALARQQLIISTEMLSTLKDIAKK